MDYTMPGQLEEACGSVRWMDYRTIAGRPVRCLPAACLPFQLYLPVLPHQRLHFYAAIIPIILLCNLVKEGDRGATVATMGLEIKRTTKGRKGEKTKRKKNIG